jgi:hypothetical protein
VRILIDECLDWRLCRALFDHHCTSVRDAGWAGLTNGKLLDKAQEQFDVFLTGDRNLGFQQNLEAFDIAVVVLEAGSTRLLDTMQLMPQVREALKTIKPGQLVRVGVGS